MTNETTRDFYSDDTFTAQQWQETKAQYERLRARKGRPIADRIAEISRRMEKEK